MSHVHTGPVLDQEGHDHQWDECDDTNCEVRKTLVEAYHIIFDIKDASKPEDGDKRESRYDVGDAAFDALSALQRLMVAIGLPRLSRSDGEGRPVIPVEPPLTIYPPDEDSGWTVSGDLREVVDFTGESTNYLVEKLLLAEGPWSQVNFDPEYSCFFGYTDDEAQAIELRDAAMRVAEGLK